jgi:hypothetical protein
VLRLALVLTLAGCTFDARPAPAGGADASIAAADARPDAPASTPDAAPPAADAPPAPDARADAGAGADTHFHYVTRSLRAGSSSDEAAALGFDLDGDLRVDNQLGVTLTTIAGGSFDEALDAALVAGDMVQLHSLRAVDIFRDPTAAWRTYRGTPQPDPDLVSGNGVFTVAPGSRLDSRVEGDLAGGELVAGPGFLVLELTLVEGAAPIPVELVGARAVVDVRVGGCSGRLGGGVPVARLEIALIPAVAAAVDAVIAADEGCREDFDDCDNTSKTLLVLFDGDGDRVISVDEVAESPVTQALLVPDVDLLDADGEPGQDGVAESISLGLGFECTRAVFTAPDE